MQAKRTLLVAGLSLAPILLAAACGPFSQAGRTPDLKATQDTIRAQLVATITGEALLVSEGTIRAQVVATFTAEAVIAAEGTSRARPVATATAETPTATAAVMATAPSRAEGDRRITFISDRDGNAEIYVMNADGSGQTNLTDNAGEDWVPAWSPDGGRIAFQSDRDGNAEIYVMNADGSGQTNLTKIGRAHV